jgi:signal recognition particle subunit SRP54
MQGILGMLPGVAKVKKQISEAGIDDKVFDRQVAIISSMTKVERKKPDILQASRKRRIAAGSGVDVADVNRLLKQHRQMADMVKAMAKGGGRGMGGMMAAMKAMGGPGGWGGMPPGMGNMGGAGMPDLEKLKALGAGKRPGLGGGQTPSGFPGMGGGLPNFPFKKK